MLVGLVGLRVHFMNYALNTHTHKKGTHMDKDVGVLVLFSFY